MNNHPLQLGLLLVAACALRADAVCAQTTQDKHHLLAQAGSQFHGDSEVDRFDGRADFVWQSGVQGTNPSFFFHEAVADGDSGVLSIFSRFSRAGGPGDPIFVDSSNRSVVVIEETINPGATTSDTVTVTARLHWNGSGSLDDGNGKVAAYLTVDQCSVGWTKWFSPLSQTSEGTECVGSATNFGTAGAGLLTVTKIRSTPIGSSSRFFVTAQIEGESSSGDYVGGEYEASGVLTIEVVGAPYEFSSPTFLTLPEPSDAALVVAAIASLATLARSRRARQAIGGRAWLGLLLTGALALHAGVVHAQGSQDKHHLRAQAGNQFHADNEENYLDGHAEALWQGGVAGVNPSFFLHEAVADGDSGVLAFSSTFSLAGGAGDPIFVSGNNASSASIEESIDPGDTPTGPVTVTARLDWGGSGSLTSPGDTDGGSVSASLTVHNCQVGFRQRFYSNPSIPVPGEPTVGCGSTFYVTGIGEASAGLLTATQIIENPDALPTRFYVTASISGEVNPSSTLEYFDSGEYQASGVLTIEVSGVDYSYSSPTFLTLPEPGDAALAVTAAAVLAGLERRRRPLLPR